MSSKDMKCPVCGSFFNSMGICLTCHPVGRERKPPKKPWSGNKKEK